MVLLHVLLPTPHASCPDVVEENVPPVQVGFVEPGVLLTGLIVPFVEIDGCRTHHPALLRILRMLYWRNSLLAYYVAGPLEACK